MSLKLRYPQILEEFDKRLKVIEEGMDSEARNWAAAETEARKELIVEYVSERKVERSNGGNAD